MEQDDLGGTLHIADLITKYRQGTLSVAETAELQAWIGQDSRHLELFQEVVDPAFIA